MSRGNRVCAEGFVPPTLGRQGGGRRSRGALELLGAVLTLLSAAFIALTLPLSGWMCAKVVPEYERAVIFRLGRVVKGGARGPGLCWFIPWLDVVQTVDLRTASFSLRPQEVVAADGVPLKVDAAVFYRVVDPFLWVTRVKDGCQATHRLVQTSLRATLSAHRLTDVLTQQTDIAKRTGEALHAASSLWGVLVERVELKDLTLPLSLQRCMASEAEAARRAREKMMVAGGEVAASGALKEAESGLPPVASHLRYLQALSSVRRGLVSPHRAPQRLRLPSALPEIVTLLSQLLCHFYICIISYFATFFLVN